MSAEKLYSLILNLYPESYRRKYSAEMKKVFNEMYSEEKKQGRIGISFWSRIILDVAQSGVEQHLNEGTFSTNPYNVIGALLLLPFAALFVFDFIGRIVQWDFIHYNRSFNQAISHTFIYQNIAVLRFVMVIAPALAVLINLIPLVLSLRNWQKMTLTKLFYSNPWGIILIGFGLFALLIIFGHDFIPCTIHGLLSRGLGEIGTVVSYCKGA